MRAREVIKSKRTFEVFLRAHGFTRGEAKAVVGASWQALRQAERKQSQHEARRKRERRENSSPAGGC